MSGGLSAICAISSVCNRSPYWGAHYCKKHFGSLLEGTLIAHIARGRRSYLGELELLAFLKESPPSLGNGPGVLTARAHRRGAKKLQAFRPTTMTDVPIKYVIPILIAAVVIPAGVVRLFQAAPVPSSTAVAFAPTPAVATSARRDCVRASDAARALKTELAATRCAASADCIRSFGEGATVPRTDPCYDTIVACPSSTLRQWTARVNEATKAMKDACAL